MGLLQYTSNEMFSSTELVRKSKNIFDKLNKNELEKVIKEFIKLLKDSVRKCLESINDWLFIWYSLFIVILFNINKKILIYNFYQYNLWTRFIKNDQRKI